MLNSSGNDVNDLVRICPKKGCPGVAQARFENQVYLECPVCSELICFECHQRYHPDMTCEQFLQAGGGEHVSEFQNCPKCDMKVNKP